MRDNRLSKKFIYLRISSKYCVPEIPPADYSADCPENHLADNSEDNLESNPADNLPDYSADYLVNPLADYRENYRENYLRSAEFSSLSAANAITLRP